VSSRAVTATLTTHLGTLEGSRMIDFPALWCYYSSKTAENVQGKKPVLENYLNVVVAVGIQMV